jgi:hypothetical protein
MKPPSIQVRDVMTMKTTDAPNSKWATIAAIAPTEAPTPGSHIQNVTNLTQGPHLRLSSFFGDRHRNQHS